LAAKQAAVATNDTARTVTTIRVFICGGFRQKRVSASISIPDESRRRLKGLKIRTANRLQQIRFEALIQKMIAPKIKAEP
jgi:hypothetical protein